MEPFKIHILGCGSATPTLKHNASSQVVEVRGKFFMVDCGEGTQVQLRRAHVGFAKIQAIFISHLHGDHCFGLIGLISTFGMLGRTAPLHVYAPADLGPMLDAMIKLFCAGLEFNVVFHAVETERQLVVYQDRSVTVETIPLQHRIPCCGYLFRESPMLPHIRRDMIDFYNIPVSQIANIKNGADWVTPDGEIIPHGRLVSPSDQPRGYAYCSDTRYMPRLWQVVKGVTTIYHEATYDSGLAERAKLYYHSTAAQAAMVARDACAGKLVLGHFSARYEDEKVLLQEAREIFPNTVLANEGLVIDV